MMLRALRFLLLGATFGTPAATRATPQSVFDSVQTARGKCPLWMAPPGTSSQADLAYTRCVLDKSPRIVPEKSPMPTEPLDDRQVNGSYAVFVNADGTVDPHLTRMWSRSSDTAFHRKALETVHQWRFEPGVRQGTAVRSAFTLELKTNARIDTLPAKLDWTYRPSVDVDTLTGTWRLVAADPPFSRSQLDSLRMAIVRRLITTRVVLPGPGIRYCIDMPDDDADAVARLSALVAALAPFRENSTGVSVCGTRQREGERRIVVPRVHRTEEGRAVLYPEGDHLPFYPHDVDGRSWTSWKGRCLARVPDDASVWADCAVSPPSHEYLEWFREHRQPVSVDTSPRYAWGPVAMTVAVTTSGGWQIDTLRATAANIPSLRTRSIVDSTCSGWSVFARERNVSVVVVPGTIPGGILIVTPASEGPPPVPRRRVRDCTRPDPLVVFLLGGLGERPSSPLTFCRASCARTHTLDPSKHTLVESPHLQFRMSDLAEATRAGEHLRMRIRIEPDHPDVIPLVVVGERYANPLHRNAGGYWDYSVSIYPVVRGDTDVRIYLITR